MLANISRRVQLAANAREDTDRSSTESSSRSPQNAKTQRATILRLLIEARGRRLPSPEIAACAQQYNARVFELRRLGFCIENKTESDSKTDTRRSWFRLVNSSSVEMRPRPSKPRSRTAEPPAVNFDGRALEVARVRWSGRKRLERTLGSPLTGSNHAQLTGLPLFDSAVDL